MEKDDKYYCDKCGAEVKDTAEYIDVDGQPTDLCDKHYKEYTDLVKQWLKK